MLVEIDARISGEDTFSVTWERETHRVFLSLETTTGIVSRVEIPAGNVFDAMVHPYCYLPRFVCHND